MSEPSRYLVSYDITDERRLRHVYQALRGYGDHVQYSVFICELSARERAQMIATLQPLIDHAADQVIIVDLGPAHGRAESCVQALGLPYTHPNRHAIVV